MIPALSDVPNYAIRGWQIEDGLPQNTVTVILQSKTGYLWMGTLAGLVRFDGAKFTVFDNDKNPELKNGRITGLYEDSSGTLWIGHETGNLTRLQNGVFESLELPREWNEDVVASIAKDNQGDLWVQSRQGRLARVRDGLVIPPVPGVISSFGLATLASDTQGQLWVWRGGQLGYLVKGEVIVPPQEPATPANFVQSFCAAKTGGLWVMRGGRLNRYEDGIWQMESTAPTNLSNAIGVLETKDGLVVIRTTDQGLWVIKPDKYARNINRADGLNSDWLGCVCEDREGDLWVGSTGRGINQLKPVKFEVMDPPDHWNGMPVLSVTSGKDGSIWSGSEGSGLYRFHENHWTHYGDSQGLTSKFVWSVMEDRSGNVWAGTWGNGLFRGNQGQFRPAPGLEQELEPMMALLQGIDGELWVGTRVGLMRYEDGEVTWFGLRQGIKSADVRAIAQAADGSVWFGMLGGGLGHLKDGVVRQFRKTDGLASDFVLSLHFDAVGALWIGTAGSGLCRLKNEKFTRIGTQEGLPNSVISNIEEDNFGYYWLSSAGGIFRARLADLNRCANGLLKKVDFITYGIWDGLETTDCSGGFQPGSCKTSDGRLWFSTRRGIVTVDPANLKINTILPTVLIEQVLADGHPVSNQRSGPNGPQSDIGPANIDPVSQRTNLSPLIVPPGSQRLEFLFTALSFSAPEKVRFKYRLTGLDADWLNGDGSRTVSYNHVQPGNYRFQVMACNNDGVWNEEGAEIAVTVLPFFWQTWWFHLLTYASGIALVMVILLLEFRRRHNRRLEKLERGQAIERERARIAQDMHDELGANLTRISLLSQTASTGLSGDSPSAGYLHQIYTSARDLTRGLDEIVWAVNPHHDTLESLLNYLARFSFEFLRSAGIRCRIHLPVQIPEWKIRSDIRHNVFLALKETLNNVVKHSGAKEVRVSLQLKTTGFDLKIEDDGSGFMASPVSERPPSDDRFAAGNGLYNISHRMKVIGGMAQITSSIGHGTQVLLSIPAADDESVG
jgi:ligand-binding sensor domain-containing protein/signal transduction histidine kinase